MDLNQLRIDITHQYAQEHAALGLKGARAKLVEAQEWQLAPVLQAGGALVFPHAGVAECAKQIAACINACIDSGADTVLVLNHDGLGQAEAPLRHKLVVSFLRTLIELGHVPKAVVFYAGGVKLVAQGTPCQKELARCALDCLPHLP